ncbi:HNH endonuclease family protein [Salinibacterium sp. ZJ77]|uniref:HNH endonuclease family protein n=1 Tax=Salinibacterium sp. ZJ77 TaxID=2708337 RepID=UPI0014247388|nr:HNH endonuclease family protein [Salinibacterium sp. ZJ77]
MSHRSTAGSALAAVVVGALLILLAVLGRGDASGDAPSGPDARPTSAPTPSATLLPDPPAPEPTAAPAEPAAPSAPAPHPALATLAAVPTATSAALWYERSAFGKGWGDPDRNGCDARNDVLARDLIDVAFRPGTRDCVVASGTLHDPYTGSTIHFVRGNETSQAVQIDHVVPLAWAWRYGAHAWTFEQRERFHSDQLNLLAVDGPTNMQKSDAGPARWMPPNAAHHCPYAEQFVNVVATYGLAMPDDDRGVLEAVLARC